MTEEEKIIINRQFDHEGEQKSIEFLNGRRKSKKTYEYEVKWVNRRENKNSWLTRERCNPFWTTPFHTHVSSPKTACSCCIKTQQKNSWKSFNSQRMFVNVLTRSVPNTKCG